MSNERLLDISDVRHQVIYQPGETPGHVAWIGGFQTLDRRIFISFQELKGNVRQNPSYDFNKPENRDRYDIKQKFYSSSDGGLTWNFESEREIFLPNLMFYPMKKTLYNGAIVTVCKSSNFYDFSQHSPAELLAIKSEDNGKTLQLQGTVECREKIYPMSLVEFRNMLLLTVYSEYGECLIFTSVNHGKTWDKNCSIAKSGKNLSFWEPAIEIINENQLICIMRTHREDIPKHNGVNYHKVILTWRDGSFNVSSPVDTGIGFRGKPELLKTSDGILIFTAPGGFFAFSLNDGENWEIDMNILASIPHNADPWLLEMESNKILCAYFIGSDYPYPPPVSEYIGCTTFKIGYSHDRQHI